MVDHEILRSLRGNVPAVPVSVLYRLGLAIVALAMVLLPLIYIALIGATAWAVYWHLTTNTTLLSAGSGWVDLLIYITPVLVGGILVVFMIKPLFAPRPPEMEPLRLDREEEPLLHDFVDRLCDVVRAPRPREIVVDCEVNASAGLRRGLGSLLSNDLTLTIGLPLAAGLTLQELAGVLAHEFGHFAQQTGMRLTYVIRSVNGWFARVVYVRDAWDVGLARWSNEIDFWLAIPIYLARFFVWVTRGVLWVLMMIGHALSMFMLRQMEFDADRYEVHLVGSEAFDRTAHRLHHLAAGAQFALSDLSDSLHEDRLVDNYPALVVENEANLTDEVRRQVEDAMAEETTSLFDTHPAISQRVKSANSLGVRGLFHDQGPTRRLFHDFDATCRAASTEFYRIQLGPQAEVVQKVAFDDFVAARDLVLDEVKVLRRYFQDQTHPLRPLPLPALSQLDPVDIAATEKTLRQARDEMLDRVPAYREATEQYDQLDARQVELLQVAGLLTAEFRFDQGSFDLTYVNKESVRRALKEVEGQQTDLEERLATFEQAAATRLHAALRLALHGIAPSDPEGKRIALARLVDAVLVLRELLPRLVPIRDQALALVLLVEQLEPNSEHAPLYDAIEREVKRLSEDLTRLGNDFRQATYPLENEQRGEQMLWPYLRGNPPDLNDIDNAIIPAQNVVERAFRLYSRVLGRLAQVAESAETALDLPPLDDPPDPPLDDGE